MILENGEFFVTDSIQSIVNHEGDNIEVTDMFEGVVFQAMEVCGDWVAARVVERSLEEGSPAYITSIKWTTRNVQIVSKQYGELIEKSRGEDEENEPDFSALLSEVAVLLEEPEGPENDQEKEG